MTLSAEKDLLRTRLAAIRQEIPPTDRILAEAAIYHKLFSLKEWQAASLIAGYISVRSEIDLTPIWQAAAAQGKHYALPCTLSDAKQGQMIFRKTEGYRPDTLHPARFGIPEPGECSPPVTQADWKNALMIVPGLSFDDQGFRIGYGGGYYDRFLANLRRQGVTFTTVGLFFSACHTPSLPHEPHDIPVDVIINERRIIYTHGTANSY